MQRDIARLTACTFDVLVVGGGVCGLTIAADAAQRGLAVALVERSDFGSGSSFNHLRTIHGGLRYLQTFDVRRARESVRERRFLARMASHAVQPLPFVLPLGRSVTRGKLAMRAGLALDALVGADRNRRVPASQHLPFGHVVSRQEALERFPGLPRQGLTGAAVWYDYVTTEPDRLTFSWAVAAHERGAAIANYVEALAPILTGRAVRGVRAVDCRGGHELEIAAHLTVNATGAVWNRLASVVGGPGPIPLLKALNLVTIREAGGTAVGGRSPAGRHFFLVPWRNRALFGTWESSRPCPPEGVEPTEAEVSSFIAELNLTFPSLDLTMADVTLVHRGVVPAAVRRSGQIALASRELVYDHGTGSSGIEGLISVAATKYTTARAVAERVVDLVIKKLGRPVVPCRTADTPLPGGDIVDVAAIIAEAKREHGTLLSTDSIAHLVSAYGSRYRAPLALATGRPEWRARVAEQSPVIAAQLVHAVRHEMALTLGDAVLRRTPLGALGYPGDAAARQAADLVGAELLWSEGTKREEIERLRRFYVLR